MIPMVLAAAALFILFPVASTTGAKEGLILCGNAVVGSIFPFMVISKMIVNTNVIHPNNKVINRIASYFHISAYGMLALMLGLVCGYPMGAKTTADLYEKKQISKKEAQFLLSFCNNGGPAFAIAAVGSAFFNDIKIGIILFICHILSSLMTGSILALFHKNETLCPVSFQRKKQSFSILLLDAIKDSCFAMLNVVGIIVFFSAFFSVLKATHLISFVCTLFGEYSSVAEAIIFGLFEITSGIKATASLTISPIWKLCIAELLFSLGGISIFCQALSFTAPHQIKTAPYLFGKALSSILSVGLILLLEFKGMFSLLIFCIVFVSLAIMVSAIQKPCKIIKISCKCCPKQIRQKQKSSRFI